MRELSSIKRNLLNYEDRRCNPSAGLAFEIHCDDTRSVGGLADSLDIGVRLSRHQQREFLSE